MKTLLSAAISFSLLALTPVAFAQEPAPQAPSAEEGDSAAAQSLLSRESQAQVIEGAPLGNQNVYVHIVEKKARDDQGRHELVLYPATVQINGKFTRHMGSSVTYSYRVLENLALSVSPMFNWYNKNTGFSDELATKGGQAAKAATALLFPWGVVGGVEVVPVYGKFAFYDGSLGHFAFLLSAGAGYGNSRVQLTPENSAQGALFGSAGGRFLASIGAGFRVLLGDDFALRLEVRDVVYSASVDNVNGCTLDDLQRLDNNQQVGGSCSPAELAGTGNVNKMARTLAKQLIEQKSSDVLNNVQVFTGFSFLF